MGKPKSKDTDQIGLDAMTAVMTAANPLANKALIDVMTESARFVADRFRQDLELQKAMLTCKSPAELMSLQAEFYQKAVEQYTSEATRMVQMMTDATQDTIEDAASGHKRRYDDIPL